MYMHRYLANKSNSDSYTTQEIRNSNGIASAYCACCVENFKHTLLPIDLHLLQQKRKMDEDSNNVKIHFRSMGTTYVNYQYVKYHIKKNQETIKTKHNI